MATPKTLILKLEGIETMTNQNETTTTVRDLALAAFLHSHGCLLEEIQLLDTSRCCFIFTNNERIPGLIAQWGTDEMNANGREYWWSYRHLLGMAKTKEREAKGVAR